MNWNELVLVGTNWNIMEHIGDYWSTLWLLLLLLLLSMITNGSYSFWNHISH